MINYISSFICFGGSCITGVNDGCIKLASEPLCAKSMQSGSSSWRSDNHNSKLTALARAFTQISYLYANYKLDVVSWGA